eukprot:gene8725-6131_t
MSDVAGRFILINNILCKTACGDGAFCPRQVFGCSHPSMVVPEHLRMKNTLRLSRSVLDESAQHPASEEMEVCDMCIPEEKQPLEVLADCNSVVLHSFGIASGGAEYQKEEANDALGLKEVFPENWARFGRSTIPQRNLDCYKEGRVLDEIVAEGHVTLLSSTEPWNFKGTTMAPLAYPQGVKRCDYATKDTEDSTKGILWQLQYMKRRNVLDHLGARTKHWKSWIAELEKCRMFFKVPFPQSLYLWNSFRNFDAQFNGARARVRTNASLEDPLVPVHPFLTFHGSTTHELLRPTLLKEQRYLHRVCHTKRRSAGPKMRGLFVKRPGRDMDEYSEVTPQRLFDTFIHYYNCLGVTTVESNGQQTFVLSPNFSCSKSYKQHCIEIERRTITETESYTPEMMSGSLPKTSAWHCLVLNEPEKLFQRIKRCGQQQEQQHQQNIIKSKINLSTANDVSFPDGFFSSFLKVHRRAHFIERMSNNNAKLCSSSVSHSAFQNSIYINFYSISQ